MKRIIAFSLIVIIVLSMSGCQGNFDIDEEAVENAWDKVKEELSNEKEETWPLQNIETEPKGFPYIYMVVTENNNRDVRICRVGGTEKYYLIDRDMDFETFKKYANGNILYTDEELEVMHKMYKAQDIGIELLQLLQAIEVSSRTMDNADEETQSAPAVDYVKSFKWLIDTYFVVVENAEETKNILKSKDDVLKLYLGKNAPQILKVGEDAEKVVELFRTTISIINFVNNYSEEGSITQTKDATKLMLEIVDTVFDWAPDELLLSQVYSAQLNALKQSCEDYFDSCENYLTLLNLTEAVINGSAVESVFISGQGEWDSFLQVFNNNNDNDNIRSCWGAEHMPTLKEILSRLSRQEGDATLYEMIESEDSHNHTNNLYWITKYIEFRIHFEFEQLTGMTLEYYYNLVKPENSWKTRWKDSYKTAPWKKNLDPNDYTYNPAIKIEK